MQTWVDLHFGDGEYPFKLGIEQIVELERKCDAGLGAIFARVAKGRFGDGEDETVPTEAAYHFTDLVEIIRLGLVGGGMESHVANTMIRAYVTSVGDTRTALKRTWRLAYVILAVLIEGYAPPGEASAGESPATPTKS